jgi:hypothetical protein
VEKRGADQEGVDRATDCADEASDGVLGVGKQSDDNMIEDQFVRKWVGDECLYPGWDFDQPAGAFGREIGGAHVILGSDGIGGVILGFERSLK